MLLPVPPQLFGLEPTNKERTTTRSILSNGARWKSGANYIRRQDRRFMHLYIGQEPVLWFDGARELRDRVITGIATMALH
jgi:hypothetical protein